MKRALSILGQTLLLLLTAIIGGVVLPSLHLSPLHAARALSLGPNGQRIYEFDWLFLTLALYAVFLLIGLIVKRLRTSWINSTAALVLTILIIGLFTKLGFKDIPLGTPISQHAQVPDRPDVG